MRSVFPELHHDIGILYLKRSMIQEAIEQFELTLREQPDYAPAYLNLAVAYQMKGDRQTARQRSRLTSGNMKVRIHPTLHK